MTKTTQTRAEEPPASGAAYIPALKYHAFTRFFDPLMRLGRERVFKQRLLHQSRIEAGHRVLDLGCGTGTLALMVKSNDPEAEVVGLDTDPAVLGIASAKAEREGLAIQFVRAPATDIPFDGGSFDRVVSSLLLHHLNRPDKIRALRETYRVLRPGGEVHVADWGRARNALMRAAFLPVQLLDGFETTTDNVAGALEALGREAGFADWRETDHLNTPLGTLAFYSGRKAG